MIEDDLLLAQLWRAVSPRERDETSVVNALEELLVAHGLKKDKAIVLDAAGGFGFPSVELTVGGWFVEYAAASRAMFQEAVHRGWEQKAPNWDAMMFYGAGNRTWEDLKELDDGMYYAVLCMGNSLPHAVTWGKYGNPGEAREAIVGALRQFHRLLKQKGILYVDKQVEGDPGALHHIERVELRERPYDVSLITRNDPAHHLREWNAVLRNGDWAGTFGSRGYLLQENELLDLLHKAGFRDIRMATLRGDCYEGFTARK